MLNALLYGPNPKFNACINKIKDDIDSGIRLNNHMLHDDLQNSYRVKYNNTVASDEYSKLDPKKTNILALTKKVNALEQSLIVNQANVTSGGGSGGGYRGNQGGKIAGVEKWRTVNKGATIQHEGKTVWLCLSHKYKDIIFDSLYVWHKPEDHDAWFDKFKSRRSKKDKITASTTAAPLAGSKQGSLNKLTIYQRLKEVLCSNLMLSDKDADEYCKQVYESQYQTQSWEYSIKQDILYVSCLFHCSDCPN